MSEFAVGRAWVGKCGAAGADVPQLCVCCNNCTTQLALNVYQLQAAQAKSCRPSHSQRRDHNCQLKIESAEQLMRACIPTTLCNCSMAHIILQAGSPVILLKGGGGRGERFCRT